MGRLDGKVALITGGARGQGAAEGKLFRAEGAEVYLTDVLVDEGQKTAAEIGATFIEHDVTDSGAWAEIVSRIDQEHGHLDVLINNAGIFHMVGLAETERELWDRTIAINQTGVFLGLHAGLRGSGGAFAYGASKWAVRGMTKSAAQELSPHGVRVNSIHPGIIETAMADEFSRKGINESIRERIPMGHYADALEVAKLALFLGSEDSSYCSGSEFVVDGGMTA